MFDLAIGAVSLGFQVTQAVVLYYRGIQNRKEEIQESLDEINRLTFAFASLNAALPSVLSVSEEDGVLLQKSLISINDRLLSLRGWLDDVGVPRDTEKLRGRIKETCRALSYPFRRDEMRAIRRKVGDILRDLQVVLDIHSLKQGLSHEKNLRSVEYSLARLSSKQLEAQKSNESNLRELGEIIQDEVLELKVRLAKIGNGIEYISRDVSLLQADVLATGQIVQQTSMQNANKLDTIIDMFGELMTQNSHKVDRSQQRLSKSAPQQTVFQLARQIPPSMQQEAFEELQSASMARDLPVLDMEATGAHIDEQPKTCPICHSAPSHKTVDTAVVNTTWGVRIATQRATRHKPHCAAFIQETQIGVSGAWKLGSKVLKLLLNVGYSSDAGAGGLSISPHIRCINMVSSTNCPVRVKMRDFTRQLENRSSPSDTVNRLKALKKDVLQLYSDGKASTFDVNERGKTTLQAFIEVCAELSSFKYRSKPIMHAKTDIYTTLAAVGCSTEHCGDTFFTIMTRDEYSAQAECLRSALGCNEDSIKPSINSMTVLMEATPLFRQAPDLLRYFDNLEPIFCAIVLGSEQSLNSCIASNPASRFYTYQDKSMLYYATAWPNGLRILLRGLDDGETQKLFGDTLSSHLTISEAVRSGNGEALEILLDAGSSLLGLDQFVELMCDHASGTNYLPFSHFADIIASRLAQKAKDVCEFTKIRLPRAAYVDLVGNRSLADFAMNPEAWKLCAAARDAGIEIPETIELPDHFPGYFHIMNLNPYMFPSLAANGFGDYLESRSREGLLPVMNLLISESTWRWQYVDRHPLAIAEVFPWLEQRGLLDGLANDTESIGLSTNASGWHYMAVGMSKHLWLRRTKWHLRCVADMLAKLSQQQSRDHCNCLCSEAGQGCSPYLLFCRSRAHGYHELLDEMGVTIDASIWDFPVNRHVVAHHMFGHDTSWMPATGNGNASIASSRLPPWSRDLIRLLTFEALEMTHTCCTFRKMPLYPGNTLHHHEQGGIFCAESGDPEAGETEAAAAKLDGLMQFFDEYLASVDAIDETLDNFIRGFWRRRMAQEYVVDPETLREFERDVVGVEIGVTPRPLRALLGEDFTFLSDAPTSSDSIDFEFAPACQLC